MGKWQEIHTVEEWKQALESSEQRQFVILKHSTRCPVSTNALQEYEDYLQEAREDVDYYLVKVIESRPVSNQIAEDLQVVHASPQMILVNNKESAWNTSHWSVTKEHMKAVLD